ncbi:hypothetical protein I79_022196 [Cricetulus griseus]|uniref:Uncharacterized protein n=1 Tax=Cricetulus griseus TaxID=10029 RepID=G3IEP5_CRIGR|nr:hypothetical protein I79_022196 [Cricetulus griseus]
MLACSAPTPPQPEEEGECPGTGTTDSCEMSLGIEPKSSGKRATGLKHGTKPPVPR